MTIVVQLLLLCSSLWAPSLSHAMNTGNEDKQLSLLKACYNGDETRVRELLDQKVDPDNEKPKVFLRTLIKGTHHPHDAWKANLSSPLLIASLNNKENIVKLLLEAGARPNERSNVEDIDCIGWSRLTSSRFEKIPVLWAYLAIGGILEPVLHGYTISTPILTSLLSHGANPSLKNKPDPNCLSQVLWRGKAEYTHERAKLLLRYGANLTDGPNYYNSPLYAASHESIFKPPCPPKTLRLLLETGADLSRYGLQFYREKWSASAFNDSLTFAVNLGKNFSFTISSTMPNSHKAILSEVKAHLETDRLTQALVCIHLKKHGIPNEIIDSIFSDVANRKIFLRPKQAAFFDKIVVSERRFAPFPEDKTKKTDPHLFYPSFGQPLLKAETVKIRSAPEKKQATNYLSWINLD